MQLHQWKRRPSGLSGLTLLFTAKKTKLKKAIPPYYLMTPDNLERKGVVACRLNPLEEPIRFLNHICK